MHEKHLYKIGIQFENRGGAYHPASTTYYYIISDYVFAPYSSLLRECFVSANKSLRFNLVSTTGYNYRNSYARLASIENYEPESTSELYRIAEIKNVQVVDMPLNTWRSYSYLKEIYCYVNNDDTSVTNTIERKENKTMNNLMKNLECGKATDIKMSPFGPAFATKENTYVAFNGDAIEDVTGMTFDNAMCFLMPIGAKDVKVGDIIKYMKQYCKVRAINEDGTMEAVNALTATVLTIVPTKNIFGFEFMTKVMCPFGEMKMDAANPFGNPFMLMAMMDDKADSKDNLMLMMALSQMNGGADTAAMNPFMWMAMMK